MKLGIMQPYFLPYIGYFQLIKAVDKYVLCDDLNYINNGWINRNNILVDKKKKLFTISLIKKSQNKFINQIYIADDFEAFQRTIYSNYAKAPFFRPVNELLRKIVAFENRCLADFVINSIKEILDYLHIETEILISSQIEKDCSLKGKYKVIDICKRLGADIYINSIGGQLLYDKNDFLNNGIELKFLSTEIITYKQFDNEFVPNLSILDVLMFNSIEEVKFMLEKYDFI